MDLIERARRYLGTMDASVSGSGGHTAAFKAAVALVQGFDLGEADALALLRSDFNPRCDPPWSERELLHKVRQAETHGGPGGKGRGYLAGSGGNGSGNRSGGSGGRSSPAGSGGSVEAERVRKRQDFDAGALRRFQAAGFRPDLKWLAERSPVDPRGLTPGAFLDAIFSPGERALVFTNFYGQGEFGHVIGKDGRGRTWRLGRRPGIDPKPGVIPAGDRCGAWFLPVPVDGKWHPTGAVDKQGNPILSRRSGASVVEWRHLMLESDDAGEREWLNLLGQLPLPITALYTSGGRSIHALVRVEAKSKGHFDAFRDRISPLLGKLGADPAAMTGVRLTRLPGVMRHGTEKRDKGTGKTVYTRYDQPRLQELLYLNPSPEIVALRNMPRLREVAELKGVLRG